MRVCACVCVCVRIQPTDGVNLSVADRTDSAGMKDDDGGDEDDDDDAMSGGGAESPAVARGATTTSSSSRRRRRRRGATVQALSALCRCLVRRHLASDGRVGGGGGGGGLLGAVAHLPLPPALQRFMLLDELDAVH